MDREVPVLSFLEKDEQGDVDEEKNWFFINYSWNILCVLEWLWLVESGK